MSNTSAEGGIVIDNVIDKVIDIGGVGEFACRTFACLVFLWSFACWVNYLDQITCRHLLVGTFTCRTFTCRQMLVDIYLQDISLWDIYL